MKIPRTSENYLISEIRECPGSFGSTEGWWMGTEEWMEMDGNNFIPFFFLCDKLFYFP